MRCNLFMNEISNFMILQEEKVSAKDINAMRKSGRVTDAYVAAKKALCESPDDIWYLRAMGWILYDFIKQSIADKDIDKLVEMLEEMSELYSEKLSSENFFALSVIQLNKFLFTLPKEDGIEMGKLTSLWKAVRIFIDEDVESRVFLFRAFHKFRKDWDLYVDFCDWWNLSNFREEDHEEQTINGKKVMSLVEQAYIEYAKKILRECDEEKIKGFIPKLSALLKDYPNYKYPLYFKSKLLLAMGQKKEAFGSLLPFVKVKRNDFWVWDFLSDSTDDEDLKFACLSKAVQCKSKPEMQVSLREKLVFALLERGYYDMAKYEMENVIEVRSKNNWKIADSLRALQNDRRMQNADISKYDANFYEQFAILAEDLIGGKPNAEKISFSGKIALSSKGFGFVKSEKNSIFVPLMLLKNITVKKGDKITGTAQKRFDKKKNQWGWTAVEIKVNN